MNFDLHQIFDSQTGKNVFSELTFPGNDDHAYERWYDRHPGTEDDYAMNPYYEITFRWAMDEPGFERLKHGEFADDIDYLGAVFFGAYKVEFCRREDDLSADILRMDMDEDDPKCVFCWDLENGRRYGLIDDFIEVPHRRTFDHFAREMERRIIEYLNLNNGENIRYAETPIVPGDWYPGKRAAYMAPITRIA